MIFTRRLLGCDFENKEEVVSVLILKDLYHGYAIIYALLASHAARIR